MTDFFASQDQARRHTFQMVLMFAIAVVLIVLSVNAVVAGVWLTNVGYAKAGLEAKRALFLGVPGQVYLWTTLVTLGIIGSGTLYRVIQLAQGGVAVAEMIGARRVARDSREPNERRLLNVVEEMALASGVSVPLVYVMEKEASINAFAAGYSPNEAVVAVTRGTLETLNRDELQGVIAHEFSHIMNGDMRLNIHLIGLLEGITLIGAIGMFVLRNSGRIRSSRDGGSVVMAILVVGGSLAAIGYVGVFFARLIKAGISRQREFLADASAVQFTRNPEGIGGALYQIGRQSGLIDNRHAEAFSHMYFGQAIKSSFSGLFATHPPIEERIERVLGPQAKLFLRSQAKRREAASASSAESVETAAAQGANVSPAQAGAGYSGKGDPAISGLAAGAMAMDGASAPAAVVTGVEWGGAGVALNTTSQAVVDSVGNPGKRHVEFARQFLAALPKELRYGAGSEAGAKAALFALVLNGGEARALQLAMITKAIDPATAQLTEKYAGELARFGARARMPVLDLALPTLRPLLQPARDALMILLRDLVEADRRITIAELVVLTICKRHLGGDTRRAPPIKHKTYDTVKAEIAIMLSLLAHIGKSGEAAFQSALVTLPVAGETLRPAAGLSIVVVESALYELKLLAPLKKPQLIKACLKLVLADGKIDVAESELVRAICAALDCPLPPILDQGEVP